MQKITRQRDKEREKERERERTKEREIERERERDPYPFWLKPINLYKNRRNGPSSCCGRCMVRAA